MSCCDQVGALVIPGGRIAIEPLLRVLVEHDEAAAKEKRVDLLDGGVEIGEVVERAAGHDRDEGARLVEVLQAHPAEERALGRVGVDRGHRMAGCGEAAGQVSRAATDLENACLGRKLREDEALELQRVGRRSDQPILWSPPGTRMELMVPKPAC